MGPKYRGKVATRASLGFADDDSDVSESAEEESDEEFEEATDKQNTNMVEFERDLTTLETSLVSSHQSGENEVESKTLNNISKDSDDELQKALHVSNQRYLWNFLVELRLQLQAPLEFSNRLPQHDTFPFFFDIDQSIKDLTSEPSHETSNHAENSGEGGLPSSALIQENVFHLRKNIRDALSKLLLLQSHLEKNNPETLNGLSSAAKNSSNKKRIRTEFESDWVMTADLDTLWSEIYCRQSLQNKYHDSVLEIWNRKVTLASNIRISAFKAMNQSIFSQVEETMKNREKVLKKTQMKRTLDRVLGKPDEPASESREHVYDEEIYDDRDFYLSILKGAIEEKSPGSTDLTDLTMRFLALHQERKKAKSRKIEKGIRKGKKLRYNEHEKLVAFMAPVTKKYPKYDSYVTTQLLCSLFGRKKTST
ncbi:protein AATF-like isoform X2 [Schistocerca gregaria]|nr:protein AATF-like isoform X2 [Schistocerca gregaria]